MANKEHVEILKRGADIWNEWRTDKPGLHPDLSSADITGKHLADVNLSAAGLADAKVSGANLSGADFRNANFD